MAGFLLGKLLMSNTEPQPKKYRVLKAYQCPRTKVWKQVKETVELLPSEATFLLNSGKLEPVKNTRKEVKHAE